MDQILRETIKEIIDKDMSIVMQQDEREDWLTKSHYTRNDIDVFTDIIVPRTPISKLYSSLKSLSIVTQVVFETPVLVEEILEPKPQHAITVGDIADLLTFMGARPRIEKSIIAIALQVAGYPLTDDNKFLKNYVFKDD